MIYAFLVSVLKGLSSLILSFYSAVNIMNIGNMTQFWDFYIIFLILPL